MATIDNMIKDFCETIRPFMQRDGGDFEYIKFKDGIVYIKMLGNCASCHVSNDTIKYIEDMMCEEIPGVIEVKEI